MFGSTGLSPEFKHLMTPFVHEEIRKNEIRRPCVADDDFIELPACLHTTATSIALEHHCFAPDTKRDSKKIWDKIF